MNSELWQLFQMEGFVKVVNDLGLLTIFAECFILYDWWSSQFAPTHCNLLVFYSYLLLLFLLYLYVAVFSCLLELTTITSVQHSTEPCTEVVELTLRGKDKRVYLLGYCWPFSSHCFYCVETIRLICVANRMTGFHVRLTLARKRLSIYLYYLVIIN